ncbi:hypothetical protein J9B83_09860 [Marinomonas sp. A79]|uniref:Uncharacterized protein n=1 Tax=Marinomonas vulgaris TaxID=2823372 RepID=A0ABS5HC61_9GAMM|nr:hypothetical protein [Marinomonas vulgaris]MBR7889246.1 hypothetical protein [Marinomonas vulgaris]
MPLTSWQHEHIESVQSALFDRLAAGRLTQWQQHYQAETVDLRYFFHSGWSS